MSELSSASQAGSEPWRPNLLPLMILTALSCAIVAYFLFTAYGVRQPSTQYTADGRAYILRLSEPLDMPPAIKTDGTQLMSAIAQVKQLASQLKADAVEGSAEEQAYQTEVSAVLAQLEEVEQTIAELKQEFGALRQAKPETPSDALDVNRSPNE